MKRHFLSVYLVGALAATTLIAQNETPPPPLAEATPEESPTPTPTPTPAIAPTPAASPRRSLEDTIESAVESAIDNGARAGSAASRQATRKKDKAGTIHFGDGKDGLTINFGGGAPEMPEPPEPPDAPDISDAHDPARTSVPEDPHLAILKNVVLPIIAIVLVFGSPVAIVALVLFYRMKKNRLLHQTIASFVANGQPIPPELLATTGAKALPTPDSDLRKGIILCMVGLGLIGFFLGVGGPWGLGFLPLAWGGGHLLTAKFAPRSAAPGVGKTTDPL